MAQRTDIVEVYRVQPILGFGVPLLITVISHEDCKAWSSELFLLFGDPERTVVDFPFSFSSTGWPADAAPIDEAFVRSELFQQAHWRTAQLMEERGYFEKYGPLPSPLVFEAHEERALYVYSVQTQCHAGLIAVRRKTKSARLQGLLDIALKLNTGSCSIAG